MILQTWLESLEAGDKVVMTKGEFMPQEKKIKSTTRLHIILDDGSCFSRKTGIKRGCAKIKGGERLIKGCDRPSLVHK